MLPGCAATTWTLGGECIGPEVEREEYEAYALFLRQALEDRSIVIQRHTLTDDRVSEAEIAGFPDNEKQRFREWNERQSLLHFGDAGPPWKQAVASYNERNADGGGCLARLPRRMSEPRRSREKGNVVFSRVGFDAAKTAAIFKVELTCTPDSCNAGLVVRLVKTPDEGWIVLSEQDWIAAR
jgi:hypothetical protein